MMSNWKFAALNTAQPRRLPTPVRDIYVDCLERFTRRVRTIQAMETAGKIDRQKAYDGIQFSWEQLQQTRRDLGLVEDWVA